MHLLFGIEFNSDRSILRPETLLFAVRCSDLKPENILFDAQVEISCVFYHNSFFFAKNGL